MGEVHTSFFKDHNHPGLHARTQFVCPQIVMLAGGIHEGEAREEGLEIETDMALGGGFAPTMLGPVQTVGDQLDGGRVHDVNEALEAEGQLRAPPRAKAGMQLLKMMEHRPKQRLRHFGVAFPVAIVDAMEDCGV